MNPFPIRYHATVKVCMPGWICIRVIRPPRRLMEY
jgi:hypothetical protein